MKEQSHEETARIEKCPLYAKSGMMKMLFEVNFMEKAFFSPLPTNKANNFKPVLIYIEGVVFETLVESLLTNKQDSAFKKSIVEVHRVAITRKMKNAMPNLFYLDYLDLNRDWRPVFNLELESRKLQIENTPQYEH